MAKETRALGFFQTREGIATEWPGVFPDSHSQGLLEGSIAARSVPISEHSKFPGCSSVTGKWLVATAIRAEQPPP